MNQKELINKLENVFDGSKFCIELSDAFSDSIISIECYNGTGIYTDFYYDEFTVEKVIESGIEFVNMKENSSNIDHLEDYNELGQLILNSLIINKRNDSIDKILKE